MLELKKEVVAAPVSAPSGEENVEVMRARIRALEDTCGELHGQVSKMRRKLFDASLEKLVADGLKAATFKAKPDGQIVAANDHAADLCGPVFEQGGNIFSLVIDRLHYPSGLPSEDSVVTALPKSYGQALRDRIDAAMQVARLGRRARRDSDCFETDYSVKEQLIYEAHDGPVRVLMALTYARDHNGHPWIQLTLVNLDAVNRDDLTGLWRRGTFDNVLVRKVDERRRMHERTVFAPPLALLMIDIDHFKRVNDTYGHQAGDDALKVVARRISRIAGRKTDLVCRYGGEEIAVILDADAAEAQEIAQRILKEVRNADTVVRTENGKASLRLTVSIGGTVFVDEEDSASRMVARADASMYEAKGKSFKLTPIRNRIVFDGQLLPDPDR